MGFTTTKNDNRTWFLLLLFSRKKARPSLDENIISKELYFKEMFKIKFSPVKISGRPSAFGLPCFHYI